MKSVLCVIAMMNVALALLVFLSVLLQVFIDPSSGPVGAFLAEIPVWPLMLISLAVALAVRWLGGHLAAERK